MSSDQRRALLGAGCLLALVAARWVFDRSAVSLHRVLADNFYVLSKEERDMARLLLRSGHGALLANWPRAGVHDAQKRALVRRAARELNKVTAAVAVERLATLKAPVAVQKPKKLEAHGDVRTDPFYWLRDDSRTDPQVLAYLKAENEYTAAALADTEALQARLFKEMRGRIQEADVTVATRRAGFFYYSRTLEGAQYSVHCRRPVPDGAGPEAEGDKVDESLPETVLLDENEEAARHSFYNTGTVSVSPDGTRLCYTEDMVGGEQYAVRVIDLKTRRALLNEEIEGCSGSALWAADSETIFWVKQDDKMRPHQVYRKRVGADAAPSELVFEDPDEAYYVSLAKSSDRELIMIDTGASLQNEVHYIHAATPDAPFQVMMPRTHDVDYHVDHWHGSLFMVKRTHDTPNSELVIAPLADPTQQHVLLEHRRDVKLEDVAVSERHLAVLERSAKVTLEGPELLEFDEAAYVLHFAGSGDFDSDVLKLAYSSLTTPTSWLAHNMTTGARVTQKVTPVLGGFQQAHYKTERLWAPSHDGVEVPVTLVYNTRAVDRSGPAALHLDAYGAYEMCNDPSFSRPRVSLLDRGVVYAIAHVRGGGDLGREWYENGKFLKKKNTFYDTIAAAEHLVAEGWTTATQMTLEGRSAGGMTVGAVANMRPDLFTGIVAGVPFVDCLTTMLDDSIPLTVGEYDEWGNPNDKEYYHYMKSYSPVDNVEAKKYPHMLVTAGLRDPRVAYWEPAKYVAKMRLKRTDGNMLLFKCEMGAGHFSQSGRFDALKELAIDFAFVLLCHQKAEDVPLALENGGADA